MKIKVPSNRLPNSQAYQTLAKMAHERLVQITVDKMIESGIVNSAYGRGLNFADPVAAEDTSNHLALMISKYLEQKYPYINLVRDGFTTAIIRGGSTGVGFGIQLVFKDESVQYKTRPLSTSRDVDSTGCTSSEVTLYGMPKWLNRYVARINRLCFEAKIPGAITLAVASYAPRMETLITDAKKDESGKAYVKVSINFDPLILVDDKREEQKAQMERSYGKFGRGRSPFSSVIGYLATSRGIQEDMNDTTVLDQHSMPLYSLAFFVAQMAQVIKTLHRKAEYVPSVFAVKV